MIVERMRANQHKKKAGCDHQQQDCTVYSNSVCLLHAVASISYNNGGENQSSSLLSHH